MIIYKFKKICKSTLLAWVAFFISKLIPPFGFFKKYKNILGAVYSVRFQKIKAVNNPASVRISPASVCNYGCLFCEIHKDNLLYPNRSESFLTLDIVKKYESFISTAYSLYFCGGSGEPLMNKYLIGVIDYLKHKYKMRMGINTNASLLNNDFVKAFIRNNFESILVSYHAGSKDGYKKLMTGNVEIVDRNLMKIKEKKEAAGGNKPEITFNFALHKLNADEYKYIFDKVNRLGISHVLISRYYGGKNLLQDKNVSYDYNPSEGNKKLDEIYEYAKLINVKLLPSKPFYWDMKRADWDDENVDYTELCVLPWTSIHFNSVLDDMDCHYAGVCNRIELFKIRHSEINFSRQKEFELLWNHPLLGFLRRTANSKTEINPICKFCKNRDRELLRNTDADDYAAKRDVAVEHFFEVFRNKHRFEKTTGIEILTENPESDKKFQKKLAEMSK
jgi:wyosine [tRNA(Phe)-imidazoG37] synthetase (radical SAM superfamily)